MTEQGLGGALAERLPRTPVARRGRPLDDEALRRRRDGRALGLRAAGALARHATARAPRLAGRGTTSDGRDREAER